MSNAAPSPKLAELDLDATAEVTTDAPAASGPSMGDLDLWEQAIELERMLPIVIRQIFTTDPDHATSELPFGQFRLCMLLHQEGSRTMSQIGDDLGISVSAVTQMADRLERAGIVERQAATGGDKRVRTLRLSKSGLEMMDTRMEFRLQRAHEVLKLLAPEERLAALNLLDRLRHLSHPSVLPVRTAAS